MKNVPYLIVLLSFFACNKPDKTIEEEDDDNNNQTKTYYWDKSHTEILGLSANTKQVIEYLKYENEGEDFLESKKIQFNQNGKLTFYNPTGVDFFNMMYTKPRFVGVESQGFEFSYNENSQISEIKMYQLGVLDQTNTFVLTYQNHGKYLPLPFIFGGLDFFLIKNLKEIRSDKGFSYIFDENLNTIEVTEDLFFASMKKTHFISGNYPQRTEIIISRQEQIISKEIVTYSFSEDGILTQKTSELKQYDGQDVALSEKIEEDKFSTSTPSVIISKKISTKNQVELDVWETSVTEYFYTYDSKNRLSQISKKNNGEYVNAKETNTYPFEDEFGNYTLRERNSSTLINWEDLNGKMVYKREFLYR